MKILPVQKTNLSETLPIGNATISQRRYANVVVATQSHLAAMLVYCYTVPEPLQPLCYFMVTPSRNIISHLNVT